MNKRWFKVAVFLVALGILFYIVNLVIFYPQWYIFQQAVQEALQAHSTIPNPADFGIDQNYWITTMFLSTVSGVSLLIGGAYLFIQLLSRILRQIT